MPDPKNKSLEGVPLFDDRIDMGLYTTVSVPLDSLTQQITLNRIASEDSRTPMQKDRLLIDPTF